MEVNTTVEDIGKLIGMNKKKNFLPKWPLRFLRWFCPEHLCEEIEGDLVQRFNRDLREYGTRRAKRRLVWNIIRFFRPAIIIRNKTIVTVTPLYMIGNYFKVASRVMIRNKTFSVINILGLTLGIASAMLLFLWIQREFSYEQFHVDKDRLYVAWNREVQNGEIDCWNLTPHILASTLREYPSVEDAISYGTYGDEHLFTAGDVKMIKKSGVFTDPRFLTMFSFPLIKGDSTKALSNPNSIVLTESFSRQLFGDKDPLGETITIAQSGYSFPFTVTGILKDLPGNTDFHFEYLISWQFLESLVERDTDWSNNSVKTYVKLKAGTDANSFNNIVKDVIRKNSAGANLAEVFLYPLTRMRLYSEFENGVPSGGGRIEIVRMLGILGACLIAIACINFVNLSTARAQKRSKEVGIRKVTGAYRLSLIMQFLCESFLIALGAGIISILIVYLALPWFSTLIQHQLTLDFSSVAFWGGVLLLIGFVGILAGSYPAFYLSSFRPVRVLKGTSVMPSGRHLVRQLLVIFQFGFAVTLIVSIIVIYQQIKYAQSRVAGYERNNLVYQPLTGDLGKNYPAYRNELIASGTAVAVTKTSSAITSHWSNTNGIEWEGKDPMDKTIIERITADENIAATLGLTIVQGRDLDLEHYPSDSTAVLLNETAVALMGFNHPIGEIIEDNGIKWHIVGVVKDFILTSPYQKIMPIVLMGGKKEMFGGIHIRLNPDNSVQKNIASMTALSSKYNPTYPFEYHFIDEEYQRKFSGLEITLTISGLFGFIAIFIACLGLLGLSTFMIESRTKEIGIRKVLGSSVSRIIRLLSMDTLKPILIGIVLFSPLAWWSMNWWLQSFDYRISLHAWIFILAGSLIAAIALITISLQTFNAARENPVQSLRME